MLRDYYYALIYAVSALVFIVVTEPKVADDYARIAGLALAVLIVLWTIMSAAVYQRRYSALPPERRGRMMKPYLAWWMGAAFLLAVSDNIYKVATLFGKPIEPAALPLLYAILLAAAVWLYPLVSMEFKMKRREDTARVSGKL